LRAVESIWTGDTRVSSGARTMLVPLSALYRVGSGVRNWMYDVSLLKSEKSRVPVVSVGNLSVGGTGKTPFSAWIAKQLTARRASPAIVLRGYGNDEPQVHRILNPNVKIIVAPSRVDGIRLAVEQRANCVVLDDAFQHRQARRDEDIVLVSADAWTDHQRLLPAGPWREPLSALSRASLVVITQKSADAKRAKAASDAIRQAAPAVHQAIVRFELENIHCISGTLETLGPPPQTKTQLNALAGSSVLAVAAIGDTDAFFSQLEQRGLRVERAPFPDHHQFTPADVGILSRRAARVDAVLCTLKDAVKLGAAWPASATPLWYVSQSIVLESGASEMEAILTRILSLTATNNPS
jgi:tetraacyldisaccharide 4'-kinase